MSLDSPTPGSRKNQASTGIAGLDHVLRGGFPQNRIYLLRGEPGSGKTTLALQFLIAGKAIGETGLYITLSETREEVEEVAASHGWSLDGIAVFELSALDEQLRAESQNTVFHPSEIELNQTTQALIRHIEEVEPARVALDSLSEMRLLADTALRYRRQMLALKQYFAGKKTTVLFLDDHSGGEGDKHVESIAHGVVTIEKIVTDYGAERRRVIVNKLRGVSFMGGYHDAAMKMGGLQVFPRLVAAEHGKSFDETLVLSGNAGLDQMLGSGLPRGSSCLILGPAGTGKSSIAMQFAVSAAQRGEYVCYFVFEETLRTLKARAQSVGMPIEQVIASGNLHPQQIDAAEMAPGQFVERVRQQVENERCRIVVLDSLNGYLQAMPNVNFLMIQLHELQTFLSHHGVLMLMTVAQHGLVGQMDSPLDVTYLADTVVLLRYFEQCGQVRKAISVIKKRTGGHETSIREFRFDSDGLRVGVPLHEFHGVLTGVPVFHGDGGKMLNPG